jgi:serine/threonine-protein kinase
MRAATGGPASLPAICMFGRYEILGRLAFGGMAEIFLARESSGAGARHVVIKRVLPNVADDAKFVEMFLNEARLAIQLNHPNICHIYEFGDLEGSYFIAMEWIDGVPLGKLIRRARKSGKGVPVEIAVRIGAQVAAALHYAHRAKDGLGRPMNIVHRDVTPHNVMVAFDGQVKLLDFGIAKAETQTQKTEAGTVKGKFSYMSPEQCTGKPIDGRSDVFALGICLWEAIVGRALYRRETQYETMHAVIHEPPPSLKKYRRGVSSTLDAIVAQALAKTPDERYQTAGELQSALELWLADNRKVVNSGNVAELMEDLYENEIQRGPLVDTNPFGSSFQSLTGNRPAPEHSSGSMSAAQPLSHPSLLSAMAEHPPPLEARSRDNRLKYAIVAIGVILGFVGAMFGADAFLTDEGENGQATAEDAQELDAATEAEGAADAAVAAVEEEGEVDAGPGAVATLEPTHAVIEVTYAPARARISLDGNRISGESPLLIDAITPGSHRITVRAPGYRPFEEEIDLSAGERLDITANLRPAPRQPAAPPGRLSINTRPWSKVYVGPRLLGTTPIAGARVTSGAVRLRLVDRDGHTHTKTVRVPPNGSERVFYDLNR